VKSVELRPNRCWSATLRISNSRPPGGFPVRGGVVARNSRRKSQCLPKLCCQRAKPGTDVLVGPSAVYPRQTQVQRRNWAIPWCGCKGGGGGCRENGLLHNTLAVRSNCFSVKRKNGKGEKWKSLAKRLVYISPKIVFFPFYPYFHFSRLTLSCIRLNSHPFLGRKRGTEKGTSLILTARTANDNMP
jgi:hypothetical protein